MKAGDLAPKNLERITPRFSINRDKKYGQGQFGNVYEGYDIVNSKLIAIKELKRPQNFRDEIETLEKLCELIHPNIMSYYGFEISESDVYVFVEYCPEGTLTRLIKKGIEEEDVLDLFRQLVEGMAYMNAKSKMHRDLKPDNILIGRNRDIKISDFGTSRDNHGLDTSQQVGTPLYAAPEVFTNIEDYSDNCDVWGAGLILHEMLTGKHPFDIKTIYELKDYWKLFQRGEKRISYPKHLHPQWEFITNLMLTHNPKKRPNFHEVLEILKKVDDNGFMRKEIRNKKQGRSPANLSTAEQYLSFIDKKLDLLIELEPKIMGNKYPHLKESVKLVLVFLAAAWYYKKVKQLIRALKCKTILYPNEKQVISNNDSKAALVGQNYRIIFDSKFTKIQNYIEEKIVPEIVRLSEKGEEMQALESVKTAYRLVLQVQDGSYDIEDTYKEEYEQLLNFHKIKLTQEKIKSMSLEHQQAYLSILTLGFLDSEFKDIEFMKTDFIGNKLNKISQANPNQMLNQIIRLRGFLK